MYYLERHILSKKGYRMVPRKTQVLDIEISEVFFDGSQSLVFRVILSSQSLEFSLPTGLEVQDLQFFFLFGLQESNYSEFMGTAYQTECIVEDLDSKPRQSSILVGLHQLPLAFFGHFFSCGCTICELQIPRRGRLREQDFLNTKQCASVNHHQFGRKT